MDEKGLGKRKVQLRGGKRKAAGRKSPFSEPTKTVSFRCPISKTEELKQYVNVKLFEYAVSQGGI